MVEVIVPRRKLVAVLGATQEAGIEEINDMSSIAAGGCAPVRILFLHSKTSRNEVPAKLAGMATVAALTHVFCNP